MLEIRYLEETIKSGSDAKACVGKPLWIDATDITKDEADSLQQAFDLHTLTVEDLLTARTRVKVEVFPDYLFCVFYVLRKGQMVELDLILHEKGVISNHRGRIDGITGLIDDPDRLGSLLRKGHDFLFHRILDMEVDNFFPALEALESAIEGLEDEAITRPEPALLSRILEHKRRVVRIRKITLAQREKISTLAKSEQPLITKKAVPYFRDVYDHAIRVADMAESAREAVANAFDVYLSTISNNMNEVMKVLSVIATIALPLTVISGIYGTNFSNLPGAAIPNGFWVMLIGMVAMVVGMLLFFRKRGWF